MNDFLSYINAVYIIPTGGLELRTHGFGLVELGSMSELMMRVAGIHVATISRRPADAVCVIVDCSVLLVGDTWFATLNVSLLDHAIVTRNRANEMLTTWHASMMYTAAFNGLQEQTREILSGILIRLCNDLHRANPQLIQKAREGQESLRQPRV